MILWGVISRNLIIICSAIALLRIIKLDAFGIFGLFGFVFGLLAFLGTGSSMNRIKKLEAKLKELEVLEPGYQGE